MVSRWKLQKEQIDQQPLYLRLPLNPSSHYWHSVASLWTKTHVSGGNMNQKGGLVNWTDLIIIMYVYFVHLWSIYIVLKTTILNSLLTLTPTANILITKLSFRHTDNYYPPYVAASCFLLFYPQQIDNLSNIAPPSFLGSP